MSKKNSKYWFNPESLSFNKIEQSIVGRWVKIFVSHFAASLVLGVFLFVIISWFFDTPTEKKLKKEVKQLDSNLVVSKSTLEQATQVLVDLQRRDTNLYKSIFESEPKNLYKNYISHQFVNLDDIGHINLSKQTVKDAHNYLAQTRSKLKDYTNAEGEIKKFKKLFDYIPSVPPVNKFTMGMGFGMKIHPQYKVLKRHDGLDLNAPVGAPVHATGGGVIKVVGKGDAEFGDFVIINHEIYGYTTLYGFLAKIKVKQGQRVKRGDLLGYISESSRSLSSNVHYEVHKDGKPLNPINFFYAWIQPAQYDSLIRVAQNSN